MSEGLPRLNGNLARRPGFQRREDLVVPAPDALVLPERAVQFGTGAFLRGFIEYFLDEANRLGLFGGRLVMVGSTGSGRDRVVAEQDGLYTLAVQGIEAGERRDDHRVVGVISRALSAATQWPEVLACARNPDLELVFSNTTEVGIVLDDADSPDDAPPRSFPAKLTLFLHERARVFDFDPARGVTVLPCELIDGNGGRLRTLVLTLAERWLLGDAFQRWIESAVPFCDTLVDRIVAGTPDPEALEGLHARLGYRDALLTIAEPYRLFAIECDPATAARLAFAAADPGVVLTGDVRPYAERKVRLLNGIHSAMAPLALLAGQETVGGALEDERLGEFVRRVLRQEILPTVDAPDAAAFAEAVLDRLANPFIRHGLFDITLHGTTKIRVRLVPSLLRFAHDTGRAPAGIALAFAAHLLFLRGDLQARRRAAGLIVPPDEPGEAIRSLWDHHGDSPGAADAVVRHACADLGLWGADLGSVPGFADAVAGFLRRLGTAGPAAALDDYLAGPAPAFTDTADISTGRRD